MITSPRPTVDFPARTRDGMNLSAAPVGAFDGTAVSELVGLPTDHEPLYLLPVGRPRG